MSTSITHQKTASNPALRVSVNHNLCGKAQRASRMAFTRFENHKLTLNDLVHLAAGEGVAIACGSFSAGKVSYGSFVSTRLLFLDFDQIDLATLRTDANWQQYGAFAHATGGGGVHAYFITDQHIKTPDDLRAARLSLVGMFAHLNPDASAGGCFLFGHKTDQIDQPGAVLPLAKLFEFGPERVIAALSTPKCHIPATSQESLLKTRLTAIASAAEGTRHNTLLKNLLPICGLVKGGFLPDAAIADAKNAATSTGLGGDEVTRIEKWCWKNAEAARSATQTVLAEAARPAGASDAARKIAAQHPYRGAGINPGLWYDRLCLAGLRAGDPLTSRRAVNAALQAAGLVTLGDSTHRALLSDDLFSDGVMCSFDDVQRSYGVSSRWVTKLSADDLRSSKTYRYVMEVVDVAGMQAAGGATPSYAFFEEKYQRSNRTVARDVAALRQTWLKVKARFAWFGDEVRQITNAYQVATAALTRWHLPFIARVYGMSGKTTSYSEGGRLPSQPDAGGRLSWSITRAHRQMQQARDEVARLKPIRDAFWEKKNGPQAPGEAGISRSTLDLSQAPPPRQYSDDDAPPIAAAVIDLPDALVSAFAGDRDVNPFAPRGA